MTKRRKKKWETRRDMRNRILRAVLVSEDERLFIKMQDLMLDVCGQLVWAKSHPDDLMRLIADVQVVDRDAMGEVWWDTYCFYLEEVNEDGWEEDDPLILIDEQGLDDGPYTKPLKRPATLSTVPKSGGVNRVVQEAKRILKARKEGHHG